MSDIKVGDLVQVVRDSVGICACQPTALGYVFRVENIGMVGSLKCVGCGHIFERMVVCATDGRDDIDYELYRLKRIPPLDELESEKNKEELTA